MIGEIETSEKKDARRFLEDFLTKFDPKKDFMVIKSEPFKLTLEIFEEKKSEEE
jgi:hypothetical protein